LAVQFFIQVNVELGITQRARLMELGQQMAHSPISVYSRS
jgi:hypothetical protein